MRLDDIKTARWLGLVLACWIVLSALVIDPGGYTPYGPPKWLVISTLIPLAALLAIRSQITIHRTAGGLWLLFLGWVALSAVLGVDSFHAWVGTPERRFGFLAWLLCAFSFVIGHRVVALGQSAVVYRALIVAGIGVGLYGFSEVAGFAPVQLGWSTTRIGSTYGSPAYLGAATALLLPTVTGATASAEGRWRLVGMASVVLVLFAALASGTRASWVGLAVAALIGVYQARRVLAVRPKLLVGALGVAALAVSFSLVGPRALDAVDLSEGTSAGRLAEWEVGLGTIAKRPFSGAGPEGYRVVFQESVGGDYGRTYGRTVIVDRAHNAMIDIGASVGIPGLGLMLLLFVTVGRSVVGALRSRDPLLIGTAAGLVAYLVQQQFLFPLAEVDPLAWLLAGMLMMRRTSVSELATWHPPKLTGWLLAALSACALVGGSLDVVGNRRAQDALEHVTASDFDQSQRLAESATQLRPDSITYAAVAAEVSRLEGSLESIDRALTYNADGLAFSARDPGLQAGRGALLLARARLVRTSDAAHHAIAYWQELTTADPNNGRYQLQLGAAYAQALLWDLAEQAWLRSVELSREPVDAHLNLGYLYLATGEPEMAAEQALKAALIDAKDPNVQLLFRAIEQQN